MNRQRKLAIVTGLILLVLGLFDLILVVALLGPGKGLWIAGHDPGKMFFHIFLFPLAVGVLFEHFPLDLYQSASRLSRFVVGGVVAVLLAVVIGYVTFDAVEGFCTRLAMPSDIADSNFRKDLSEIHQEAHRDIRQMRESGATEDAIQKRAQQAKYDYKQKFQIYVGENCTYLSKTSIRKWSADVLTLLAAVFVVGIFGLLLSHLFLRKRLAPRTLDGLIIVLALVLPWFVLRGYSEWYINFGDITKTTYMPFTLTLVVAVIALFLVFILQSGRTAQKIAVAVLAGIPVIIGVIDKINPGWFGGAAEIVAAMSPIGLGATYVVLTVTIAALVWFMLAPPNGAPDVNSGPIVG